MPSLLQNWLFFVSALAGLVGFWLIAYGIGYKKGKKSLRRSPEDIETGQLLLTKIYAPLRKLLIDTHITSCEFVRYPYFRTRLKRAFPHFKHRKFKNFVSTLFNKGISKTTGVDFGSFPLELIERIIKDNIMWCDSKLVSLLQDALRAKYENPLREDETLSNEDIKLIECIYDEYESLSKKLVSKAGLK
ncbi:hypothetical protein ES705_09610 [subsurface metagenome]